MYPALCLLLKKCIFCKKKQQQHMNLVYKWPKFKSNTIEMYFIIYYYLGSTTCNILNTSSILAYSNFLCLTLNCKLVDMDKPWKT